MTLRQHTSPDTHTTDITFRAVCQDLHDSFAAAGLVQTADTGQINLATVTRPTAGVVAGYEIWRFNDALQATSPIFFKFEYGCGGHATGFGFWLTTGAGSDGVGAITVVSGTVTTRKNLVSQGNAPSGTPSPCYFNYLADGSGFGMVYWPMSAATAAVGLPSFFIERFRNYDGTPNADGWCVFYATSGSSFGTVNYDARFTGTSVSQPTAPLAIWPIPPLPSVAAAYNASAVFGTTLYPIPVFTGAYPRTGGPSQLLLGVGRNDLGPGATVVVPHYGVARTWVAAGPGGTQGWGILDPNSKITSFIMRAD